MAIESARLTVGPLEVNCYVLFAGGEAVVVDPGDEPEKILSFLSGRGLKVKRVILTHAHFDHCASVPDFMSRAWQKGLLEQQNQPVEFHQKEKWLYDNLAMQGSMFGIPISEPWAATAFLAEGEDIVWPTGERLQVLATPGHSPGSLSFYDAEGGGLYDGDVLFQGGIGRTDLWGSDYEQLMHSIRERILTLPAQTTVWPGHGPETTVGLESGSNPFLG